MARGPLPEPRAVKDAKGNPGKRKKAEPRASLPTIAAGAVRPYGKLRVSARYVWTLLAPELQRLNLLRSSDAGALSRYCEDVVQYWQVTEDLRREGLTYKVESNHGTYKRINPLFAVQDRVAARLVTLEDRFGLSPQARQALLIRASALSAQGQLPLVSADSDTPSAVEFGDPIGLFGPPIVRH